MVLKIDDKATGISTTNDTNDTNDVIFDLSGRRVSKAMKGINIMNGRKVVVKCAAMYTSYGDTSLIA